MPRIQCYNSKTTMLKDPVMITYILKYSHTHVTQSLCNETTELLLQFLQSGVLTQSIGQGWGSIVMYIILSKAVEKRRTEYEMVTTNNTSQCLCCAKEGEIPQGQTKISYCSDNTEILGMAPSWISGILDFMITGSGCHVTFSNCLPH